MRQGCFRCLDPLVTCPTHFSCSTPLLTNSFSKMRMVSFLSFFFPVSFFFLLLAHSFSRPFFSPLENQRALPTPSLTLSQSAKYSVSELASSKACLGLPEELQRKPRSQGSKALRKHLLEMNLSKISQIFLCQQGSQIFRIPLLIG